MKFEIIQTTTFEKELRKLAKKYASITDEVLHLIDSLEMEPTLGRSLGGNFYKLRLSIASKGRGKSGGARVITYVKIVGSKVYLLTMYDKSEKSTVSSKELKELLKGISE